MPASRATPPPTDGEMDLKPRELSSHGEQGGTTSFRPARTDRSGEHVHAAAR